MIDSNSRPAISVYPFFSRLIAFVLVPLLLYGFALPYFDFWSDDFGYFLNFANHSSNPSGITEALGSYLTGGVPRLQVGWHITHQLLFLFFGKLVWAYFLVQIVVLSLNSFLLEKVLRPITGSLVSFWSAVFLLISPFYQESFYWVSANYGFFQLFFLLVSYLLFARSFTRNAWARWSYTLSAAAALVASCLFMEQSVPFFGAWPLVFVLFNWRSKATNGLLKWAAIYLALAAVMFFGLYAPQLLIIKSASPTSLVDSLAMYYPTPLNSLWANSGIFLRQGIAGVFPSSDNFLWVWNHGLALKFHYIALLIVVTSGAIIFFGWISLSAVKKRVEVTGMFFSANFLGMLVWLVAATVVVLPISSFCSRYIYLIQSAGIPLMVAVLAVLSGRLHKILFPTLATLCVASTAAFYYGAFFPLTDVQRAAAPQVLKALADNPAVKAVVFQNVPMTFGKAVGGVWLNYHAAEWWIRWNLLPQKDPVEMVGIAVTPVLASDDQPGGFRLSYGPYPPERMKTVYRPEQVLFVNYLSSPLDSDQKFEFRVPTPLAKTLNEEPRVLSSSTNSFDIALPKDADDLRGCFVDVVAEMTTTGNSKYAGAMHLYKTNGTYLGYASGFSVGEEGQAEHAFFRTVVEERGPYMVRFNLQPWPVVQVGALDPPVVTVGKVKFFACGKEYHADTFVGMHNPDPKNPYLRWVSPQKNYAVTFAYPGAELWESFYGIGVNDSMNRGDFYCFPDDTLLVRVGDAPQPLAAYLGMLSWRREVEIKKDKLVVRFSRSHGDGAIQRQKMDVMPESEWPTYPRQDLPVKAVVSHSFDLNKNYYSVQVELTSQSKEKMHIMYGFEDSSVFDFKVGSDRGVQTLLLSTGTLNQGFSSTRPREFNDLGIVFRIMEPRRYNMGVFEYSTSPYLYGHNLASNAPRNLEYLKVGSELKMGQQIPVESLLPTRNHGLSLVGELSPGETKVFEYSKVMLSGWYDLADLKQQAISAIASIEAATSNNLPL